MTLLPSIFRAYDIRGIVDDTITAENVYVIGRAIGSEALARGETQILVGRDGRLSGPAFSEALITGLLSTGCDVCDIGAVPTPLLYFATHTLSTRSGVMVTGSHNPRDYNGLKIVLGGDTLAEGEIQALYHRICDQRFVEGSGKRSTYDVVERYLQAVTSRIQLPKKLKVVVDAANGITGVIAPELLRRLGCEVIELFCDIDGHFPNHAPDPSQQENLEDLITAVKTHGADLGLALDGDGDRLGVITPAGKVVWPDQQLMLFAKELLAEKPGSTIVYDIKCTRHLSSVIANAGGVPLMWKTGHSLIKAKMRELGALLAGEMSGHLFFKHRWYGFDDGLYAAARMLEIVAQKTCAVFNTLPESAHTPELKVTMPEDKKFPFMAALVRDAVFEGAEVNTIDGLRVEFSDGWGLIRSSNTSPALTLRFEADTHAALERIKALFREQLWKLEASLVLPF